MLINVSAYYLAINFVVGILFLKKRFTIFSKYKWILLTVTTAIIAFSLFCLCNQEDEAHFRQLTAELFTQEMLSDTLNMHYTLASPENFGIHSYTPTLSCYHREKLSLRTTDLSNLLAQLRDIRPLHLSPSDRKLHKLLMRYLENSYSLSLYPYFGDPLSPSSGMQGSLPILLAEYTFRNKQDVRDYLQLLSQADLYFDSLLQYKRDKAAAGIPTPKSTLKEARLQCDTIVTNDALRNQSHFLQTSFRERLSALVNTGAVSPEEANEYLAANDSLLTNVLSPVYERLGDELLLMEDESTPLQGLGSTTSGKEYYKALLISQTGSYRAPDEIRLLLQNQLSLEYKQFKTLFDENPAAEKLYTQHISCLLPFEDEEQMLADLQSRMAGTFPALPGEKTMTKIKMVSENLEPYCAPAFYLTAPLDDTSQNVIYINRQKTLNGLELYTTLAHEGFPGHLYQTVYHNRHSMAQGEKPLRQILWYGGYLEGWAIYSEFLSYDYISAMYRERQNPAYADMVQLEKHNRSLQLCLYSLLDLYIHGDNYSVNEVSDFLSTWGIEDPRAIQSIYSYIVQEPCNYLKYYLGYLEILLLKERASQLWQSNYSDYCFHKFLLDCGPADFLSLEEFLREYDLSCQGDDS